MRPLSSIQNIVSKQLEQLKQLAATIPDLRFEWSEPRGTASFIRGQFSRTELPDFKIVTDLKKYKESAAGKTVSAFLEQYEVQEVIAGFSATFPDRKTRVLKISLDEDQQI